MSLRKYALKASLCLLLQAGTHFGMSRSVNVTSPEYSYFGFLRETAKVPVARREVNYSPTSSTELTSLMLPSNGKGNKHNSHGEDKGDWDNRGSEPEPGHEGKSVSVQVVFGDRDRQIIRDYCAQPSSSLPPGLAKRGGQLPPGLEKQLRRNGQLPPGLQKKVQRFPVELERRLPPLPRNYVRVFVAGRGLIVDAQFNIVDIIDIFR